jgi:molybdate transport system regulatory protein
MMSLLRAGSARSRECREFKKNRESSPLRARRRSCAASAAARSRPWRIFGCWRQGPGEVRLLELVEPHGSITASGKTMDMSYRKAWLLVDELNGMFVSPFVETRPGGRGGGNARLTLLGRAVVQLYRSIEQDAHEAAATKLQELDRHIRHAAKGAGKAKVLPARAGRPAARERT